MHIPQTIINIEWSGPIPYESAIQSRDPHEDFGIYAIYGGASNGLKDSLLYLGRAKKGSFGWRLEDHASKKLKEGKAVGPFDVHLGRLVGESTPSLDIWERGIDLAEALLIWAHKPPLNVRIGLGDLDESIQDIHVCNWGERRAVLPEVSGLYWSSNAATILKTRYRCDPEKNQ